jgi:hypothetical protein
LPSRETIQYEDVFDPEHGDKPRGRRWYTTDYEIFIGADVEWVRYGDEFRIPQAFSFEWHPKEADRTITLFLQVIDNELVCIGMIVAMRVPKPLRTLRDISIDKLKRLAGERAAFQEPGPKSDWKIRMPVMVTGRQREWRAAYERKARRRGKQLPDEHYQQVAQIYRDALKTGRKPTKAVAEDLHTAYSNAGRWVVEARRRGFLEPAPGAGRAGEAKTKPKRKRPTSRKRPEKGD